MKLFRIDNLVLIGTLNKNGIFIKRSVKKAVRAAIEYDYLIAENFEDARIKIKSNPIHYIHYGFTLYNAGAKTRDFRKSDSFDADSIVVSELDITDVTNSPPQISSLKNWMDAKDFLAYCKENLSSKQLLSELSE